MRAAIHETTTIPLVTALLTLMCGSVNTLSGERRRIGSYRTNIKCMYGVGPPVVALVLSRAMVTSHPRLRHRQMLPWTEDTVIAARTAPIISNAVLRSMLSVVEKYAHTFLVSEFCDLSGKMIKLTQGMYEHISQRGESIGCVGKCFSHLRTKMERGERGRSRC